MNAQTTAIERRMRAIAAAAVTQCRIIALLVRFSSPVAKQAVDGNGRPSMTHLSEPGEL
jgi:hypothetical protein